MKSAFFEVSLDPDLVHVQGALRAAALKKAGLPDDAAVMIRVRRRSVDARPRRPRFTFQVEVGTDLPDAAAEVFCPAPPGAKRVIVVGAGPAGYFAALSLLEHGIKPVVLERGKDVNARRKDLKKIYTEGLIDPHSNYCFGEGGAGTYSDGKLYTRATKRGNVSRVLDLLVQFGASPDIRIDAHPHLGSNVLPGIVRAMRAAVQDCGGEVHFGAHVADLLLSGDRVTGVRLSGGEAVYADAVILATGHSARDVFHLLAARNIAMEAKPFAMGVRIEHPQPLIDEIFYHHTPRHPALPAASYRITTQASGRGVFSFCMCPGGFVVPASTAPGELVLNGMSLASRNAPFANAGLVVELRLEDMCTSDDPLQALAFQAAAEKAVFACGDGVTQKAPAQRVPDFVRGVVSEVLPPTSYIPGIYSAPLHDLLPEFVAARLRAALPELGRRYKGYDSAEAKVLAVESRTSSPVRILRDGQTLEHPAVRGLFPCGEGAGYAGGIVSAAMDGEKVAAAVAARLA
ncbi:FAD dependent oxidoreductase [Oleidesulfovibrio alaskensis G20]|uniref:FAD dependent oxidoreductase n=1 Tax=Oleidesulfovibrio alaskensis (strain ATCC BAA-1058 / DSM 17464 / G20) TaxID=207559 RepID=Q30YI3_OLEA2|nr:FAD-dependent oxidoreductase [Oleidesulfovibrio alaskensis]ABB39263.1 FAD dependent oxidoreductase [Oleidesulfovibrio alaskensis G20]MBG0771983.1 FAD-dependent oxidoreductase [Oleidesulfovibrio alaskensis]